MNTMMKVPGRSKAAVGGGPMYVLMAGLSNTPVQTTSISSTIKIKDSIARVCIVAYEIEESQVDWFYMYLFLNFFNLFFK